MRPEDNRSQLPSGNHIPERHLIKEATAWFVRQAAGDFTPVERRQLEAWCAQSPAHARAYRNVSELWNAPEMHMAAAQTSASSLVPQVREQPRHVWRFAGTAAAAVLLMISLTLWSEGLLIWLRADYSTGVGEQRVVTLPDQSVVTLNTDTSIAVRYASDRRYIELLRGEASFAVQSNPARPFTVESHGVSTTAIGTRFVVKHRSADIQVTVLNGSVLVDHGRKGPDDSIRLASGDQVSVGRDGAGSIDRVDTTAIAAWMQGRLVFVRTPLSDVVLDLARYHRGYIIIWNPALQSLPVTGIYNLSDPSHILTALADTLPIRMVRLTDHLVVIR